MHFLQIVMAFLGGVLEWIESWPATFVGVIVGSLFTLGGLVFTNRNNLRNLERQLQHNRDEKAAERLFNLRRDVYLDTAEAIAAGTQAIVSYPNLDCEESEILKDFNERSVKIAKVHVVANEQTAIALTAFMRELSYCLVDLGLKRQELTQLLSRIKAIDAQVARHGANRDQYVELMKQHNIAGTMDQRRMEVLQGNFEFDGKQADSLREQREKLAAELRPKHMLLISHSQAENLRISKHLLPLVVRVREEMGCPIDSSEYEKVFSDMPILGDQILERFFGVPMPNKQGQTATSTAEPH